MHRGISSFAAFITLVHGIFFKLDFPFVHFGTQGVTTDSLLLIVWEAVRQLDWMQSN